MRYFIKLKDLGNKIDFFDEQLSVIDEKITYLEEAKGKVIWQSDAANEFYNYYDMYIANLKAIARHILAFIEYLVTYYRRYSYKYDELRKKYANIIDEGI
jgi:hypothetical protein